MSPETDNAMLVLLRRIDDQLQRLTESVDSLYATINGEGDQPGLKGRLQDVETRISMATSVWWLMVVSIITAAGTSVWNIFSRTGGK